VPRTPSIKLPKDKRNLDVGIGDKVVRLTNLDKLFWPKLGVTKRDLIQYYVDVARAAPSPARPRHGDEALSKRRG
jgi:hypothetical protein